MLQLSKSKIFGDKSYADELNMERGIIKSRVAFALRSSEIQPLVDRFVTLWQVIFLNGFVVPFVFIVFLTFNQILSPTQICFKKIISISNYLSILYIYISIYIYIYIYIYI